MKLAIAFVLGMVAMVCIQGKTADWLVLPFFAFHLDRGIYCNDKAAGLGWERSHSESNRSQITVFRNSNCEWSAVGVKCGLPLQVGDVRLGGCAGGVTGYGAPVMPAGGFVATYERKTWGVNVIMVPPFGDSSPGVIWLQAKVPW